MTTLSNLPVLVNSADVKRVAYRTSAQDGAGSWSVPGREAGMDRSWDASVYNQNSMAGRIAARRLAGRSPRSPSVSTAIVPKGR